MSSQSEFEMTLSNLDIGGVKAEVRKKTENHISRYSV